MLWILSSGIGSFCHPLSKSISFDFGSYSGAKSRISIRDGKIAACPTNSASWFRKPDNILVRPDIESGVPQFPRTFFLSRESSTSKHCHFSVEKLLLSCAWTLKITITAKPMKVNKCFFHRRYLNCADLRRFKSASAGIISLPTPEHQGF